MSYVMNIMLIEDDSDTCEQITRYAETFIDIKIIKVTDSSFDAIQYLLSQTVDVVILDLELQQGEGSGMHFLSELANTQTIKKPYILVTTNNSSSVTYELVRNLGADFILYKHSRGYSHCTAIDFLHMTKEQIHKIQDAHNNERIVSSSTREDVYQRMIKTELNAVGISPKVKGYKYLMDAIYFAIIQGNTDVYEKVSQKHNKTVSSITQAIHTAIAKAWKSTCIDDLEKHYTARTDPSTGTPTNIEFISYYADKLSEH